MLLFIVVIFYGAGDQIILLLIWNWAHRTGTTQTVLGNNYAPVHPGQRLVSEWTCWTVNLWLRYPGGHWRVTTQRTGCVYHSIYMGHWQGLGGSWPDWALPRAAGHDASWNHAFTLLWQKICHSLKQSNFGGSGISRGENREGFIHEGWLSGHLWNEDRSVAKE
jgi:hypothetical protein